MEQLARKRREALACASPSVCEQFGVCVNCGAEGHAAAQCPRPLRQAAKSDQPQGRRTRNAAQQSRGGSGGGHSTKSKAVPMPSTDDNRRTNPNEGARKGNVAKHDDGVDDDGDDAGCRGAADGNREEDKGGPPAPRVLCVAEKPSVANIIAEVMSGGRKRTRTPAYGAAPMCRLHDFYAYFPPARQRCSVTVTSVIGHMQSLDFDEDTGPDCGGLYGARTKKVNEHVDVRIDEHITHAAAGDTTHHTAALRVPNTQRWALDQPHQGSTHHSLEFEIHMGHSSGRLVPSSAARLHPGAARCNDLSQYT